MKTVKDYIRTIPDFPEKGIMFRDVTSVIQDADVLKLAIDEMIKRLDGLDFDVIAGAESRGFVFGMPIAYEVFSCIHRVCNRKCYCRIDFLL